jgi:DNA-binding NtrC family response regulator
MTRVPEPKQPKRKTSRKPTPHRRGTVLIVDTDDGIANLTRALGGDDVTFVTASTMVEARRRLKSGLKLILCGVNFDGGRMFEFLRLAKDTPATAAVPFICVRAVGVLAKPLVPRGIEVAARALGAADYVDHLHAQNTVGEAKAARTLREKLIQACRS